MTADSPDIALLAKALLDMLRVELAHGGIVRPAVYQKARKAPA